MDARNPGKKLRSYRSKCGWSLKECSEKTGISAGSFAGIELGEKAPKIETFILILNTLNASTMSCKIVSPFYDAKSNNIIRKSQALDAAKRKRALGIFEVSSRLS